MKSVFFRNICNCRRLILFLGLIVFFVFQGRALAQGGASSDRHFLWSMEANGNTYYFLGSLHVMKGDAYPLAAKIENAYRDCEKIIAISAWRFRLPTGSRPTAKIPEFGPSSGGSDLGADRVSEHL